MTNIDPYARLVQLYDAPVAANARVTEVATGKQGSIVGAEGSMVEVQFDGDARTARLQPLELDFADGVDPVHRAARYQARWEFRFKRIDQDELDRRLVAIEAEVAAAELKAATVQLETLQDDELVDDDTVDDGEESTFYQIGPYTVELIVTTFAGPADEDVSYELMVDDGTSLPGGFISPGFVPFEDSFIRELLIDSGYTLDPA